MTYPVQVRKSSGCLLLVLLLGGCHESKPPASPQDHGPAPHHHVAPHGGTTVELGEEAFHLEFVLDPQTGTLTAYMLDGHMENFVRIPAPSFRLKATSAGGQEQALNFQARANHATGESIGATSQFEAQSDWLKTNRAFRAFLPSITLQNRTFTNITFPFSPGNPL